MAYDEKTHNKNLIGGFGLHHYYSETDNMAAITASGYFNAARDAGRVTDGDIMHIHASDSSRLVKVDVPADGVSDVTVTAYVQS